MRLFSMKTAAVISMMGILAAFLFLPQGRIISMAAPSASGTGNASASGGGAATVGNADVIGSLEDLAFLSVPAPSCDITYDFGNGKTFEIDPAMALSLMKTNADGSYYIDQTTNYYVVDSNKVRTFLAALENMDMLTGGKLTFTTTGGKSKEFSAGSYGMTYQKRKFDTQKELNYLRGAIMTGAQGVHTPALVLDTNTYVEVDLTAQKAYYYQDGKQAWSSNIVSGNTSNDHGTPEGVYYLRAKIKDTKLIGEDYESPVSYWMPFIGNSVGLHDATWRWSFGGTIYKTSGSHGCVNLPLANAETLFNMISTGTPVIVYYE